MIKEFNEAFGRTPSQQQEQTAFVNRAHNALADLQERVGDYNKLFNAICFELGVNPNEYHMSTPYGGLKLPAPGVLAGRDFMKTIELLVAVMKALRVRDDLFYEIDKVCRSLVDRASTDLGIVYDAGIFYPKGEPELDAGLINHSLTVLRDFPNEDKDLRIALDNHRGGKTSSVVETCYRCVEGLARQILGNNETLINNRPDILRRLNLSDPWRRVIVAYIDYGNEYGRHGSPARHNATPDEVEAYLYQTCLLVRLIIKIK